ISGPNLPKPLAFGTASAMLEACETGPDSAALLAARDGLVEAGLEFSLNARMKDNGAITVCGRPVGGHAVMLFNAEITNPPVEAPRATASVNYCGLLEALPIPAWIRGEDRKLVYANRAFLEITGTKSIKDAIDAGVALDPCEADLASDARDS